MIVLTCPGQINPSMETSLSLRRASIAGGISLCPEYTKKFFNLFFSACLMVAEIVGAVVSNPIPRNITFLTVFSFAISRASRAE